MFTPVLLAVTVIAGIAITLYRYAQNSRQPLFTLILALCGLALIAGSTLLDRPLYSYPSKSTPVAIAIAFDLSPSMLAIPDPLTHPDTEPRWLRAREVLLEFFRTMEQRQANMVVSLLGFTKDAEIIMGWDYSGVQLQEILRYGLSPDLFSSSGTSIEAAVGTVVDAFDMLPQDLKKNSRKIAILVSDGENTTPAEYFGYALEELASSSFDVIALQVGLPGTNEGVPRYGQVGEFLGFEKMSGNTYSTPDVETMLAISRASPQRALYVRAEESDAVAEILSFAIDGQDRNQKLSGRLFLTLGLFGIVVLVCARVLR